MTARTHTSASWVMAACLWLIISCARGSGRLREAMLSTAAGQLLPELTPSPCCLHVPQPFRDGSPCCCSGCACNLHRNPLFQFHVDVHPTTLDLHET